MTGAVVEVPQLALAPLRATVTQDDLRSALTFVARAIPARPTVPVLAGVRLDAAGGQLVASAFDFTLYAETAISAPQSAGGALVSFRQLRSMVGALPSSAQIALRSTDSALVLVAGGVEYRLPLMRAEDYPTTPRVDSASHLVLEAPGGLAELAQVTVATGVDDTLPVLTAVCLTVSGDGHATMAATDRYRLAISASQIPASLPAGRSDLLLPARVFMNAARVFARDKTPTRLLVAGEWAWLTSGARALAMRPVDGIYPKIGSLIPTLGEGDLRLTADPDLLLSAARCAAAGGDRYSPIRLHVDEGLVTFHGGDLSRDDMSGATVKVTGVTIHAAPNNTPLAMNAQYLAHGLGLFPAGAHVHVEQRDHKAPIALTCDEKPGFTYLLMPVRMSA